MGPLTLTTATEPELACIEHLMQFYNYDLSEWCAVEFGPGGLYALRPRQAYWAQPSVWPYLARVGGELAGFAVVDAEVMHPGSDFNLGYFFLARRYRGRGLAQQMLDQLLARHPGRWEVYFYDANRPAARFWPGALARAGVQDGHQADAVVDGQPCQLLRFSVAPG